MGLQPSFPPQPHRTRAAWETLLVTILLVVVFFTLVFWLGAQLSGRLNPYGGF